MMEKAAAEINTSIVQGSVFGPMLYVVMESAPMIACMMLTYLLRSH